MPDISEELEKIADNFSDITEKATDDVVNGLHQAMKDMNQEQRMVFLDSVPVDNLIENKITSALVIYETGIRKSLEATFTTASLSESALKATLNLAKKKINDDVIRHLSNSITDKLIDGIANGKFPNQIIKDIQLDMPKHQITTLVNTTYKQFNNSVTNLLAEDLPDNTKFVYIGAWDEKTRDRCKEKIAMSPATKKEILEKYGNLDNELWNCRHQWEEMSDKPFAQGLAREEDVSISGE